MLKRTQAITGMVFALFLSAHLINTWLAPLGRETYDNSQALLQSWYQAPLLEAAILSALLVHIIVGLWRRKREGPGPSSGRARWHRYAGYFLTLVIGGHIVAVRGPSWFYAIYPGFDGVAFSLDFAPGYFFPYYFLLATAGFYHGFNGLGIAGQHLGITRAAGQRLLRNATILAALATGAALLAFAGVWGEIGDPYEGEFAQLYLRIMHEIAL